MRKSSLAALDHILPTPFDTYIGNITLAALRWRRFWFVGPKSCQAWAFLISVNLGFCLAARALSSRPNIFQAVEGSVPEWLFPDRRQREEGDLANRLSAIGGSGVSFQALFPEALLSLLSKAAVPQRLIERYVSEAESGSELHLTVLLQTKIPVSVAREEAEKKARAGILLGHRAPEMVEGLLDTELRTWQALDSPELPAWPLAALQSRECFDDLALATVSKWEQLRVQTIAGRGQA